MRPRRARTSARSLATLRLELFDDGRPFAARAQQPLDRLAERPLAAARVELPRRRSEHLGCRIGRRRRDRRAQHRREVGEVIAEVKNLLESNAKLFGYALALGQLVRRPLVQLVDPQLPRPPHQRRRATARDQHDRDPRLLRQLRPEAITNVEVLDLPLLANVDDLPVRPDAVDVGNDDADGGGGHRREAYPGVAPPSPAAGPAAAPPPPPSPLKKKRNLLCC